MRVFFLTQLGHKDGQYSLILKSTSADVRGHRRTVFLASPVDAAGRG